MVHTAGGAVRGRACWNGILPDHGANRKSIMKTTMETGKPGHLKIGGEFSGIYYMGRFFLRPRLRLQVG